MESTEWKNIVGNVGTDQYESRIEVLKNKGIITSSIEETVGKTILNLKNSSRSLVIFGEPQSGKTEMMIALNAKLLDEGYSIIVNLLTDSVDLLEQSLNRFRESGINPSPKQFNEIPDEYIRLRGRKWLIFCKKNAKDLQKLIDKLRNERGFMIIDDEADYASPDGNINKAKYEKTKINGLISELINEDGRYIGVTATPARLNLNNTFQNESESWVNFRPHPAYVGQDFFFPSNGSYDFRLHTFNSDEGDEKKEIERAVLHFMCGVAELHKRGQVNNYTMLIHTSGTRKEHEDDVSYVRKTLDTLASSNASGFERLRRQLFAIASEYRLDDEYSIGEFVLRNIERSNVVKINSSPGGSGRVSDIANPTSLFSFGVGGNIISRGVTFNNLLSMYFTRTVKGRFAQDTYIQRARMFGSRQEYKNEFQLWIPETLLANWVKCFTFHKLALEALRTGAGVPVWLADHKTTPTSAASIDKSSVDIEGGEMSFGIFKYEESVIKPLFKRNEYNDKKMLDRIREFFDSAQFPEYVSNYISQEIMRGEQSISFHEPSSFGTAAANYTEEEKASIRRTKGIFSTNEYKRSEKPQARHHLKIFYNENGFARLFYKINSGPIKFMQNRK